MDRDDQPPIALITGASSGIGAATVQAFTDAGIAVHAAARRKDRLEELAAATGCVSHVLDVRDPEAVRAVVEAIGPIDILVNNAGLGSGWGPLVEASYADIDVTITTNVTAVIHLVQVVAPGMIERGRGHIVNVGSMAGLYPLPAALYGASKGAIHRLSTNLRLELQGTGVRVTEICPGRVESEFYDVAIVDPDRRDPVKRSGAEEITAAECADTIVYAVQVPPHVNINRIEMQPVEQTYGGSQFVLRGSRS